MRPGVERIAGIAEVLRAVPQKALLAEEVGVMAFGGVENYPGGDGDCGAMVRSKALRRSHPPLDIKDESSWGIRGLASSTKGGVGGVRRVGMVKNGRWLLGR